MSATEHPDVTRVLETARETMTVGRVFGEPYEEDGITMIPVASIAGGGGGGGGEEDGSNGKHAGGSGAGFGMRARPAGVFVVDGEQVRWQPAVDVNGIVAGLLSLGALLVVARAVGGRRPGRRDARRWPRSRRRRWHWLR